MNLRSLSPWMGLVFAGALLAGTEETSRSRPAPAITIFEQKVAVKEVCAWPKLTRLPDGSIAALIYDQPFHGRLPGDVAVWGSTDEGKTWEFRGRATQHEPNMAWLNHALGLAKNGDLLVVTSGRELTPAPAGQPGEHVRFLTPVTSRSRDGGRTWVTKQNFPDSPDGLKLIPFGNIEAGADGALRVAAYTFTSKGQRPGPRVDTCYVMRSGDDGLTWSIQSAFGTPAANETDLMYLGGGNWLAAARNLEQVADKSAHSVDLYASSDDAQTWTLRRKSLTKPMQHPADLLRLADGRIVLTYGERTPPDFGVDAIISLDDGLTWSAPVRLTKGIGTRDSGYPSSVQLADGSLLTAYYAATSADYAGYQLGVVHWQLDK